ncbi:hypothetical protein D3C80_405660 [compost metagenome]
MLYRKDIGRVDVIISFRSECLADAVLLLATLDYRCFVFLYLHFSSQYGYLAVNAVRLSLNFRNFTAMSPAKAPGSSTFRKALQTEQ